MTASQRRNPFAQPSPWSDPNDPLALIRMPEKKKRERTWEKSNRAYTCRVPVHLTEKGIQVREAIKSIAYFGDDGRPREDNTTVDDVARELLSYALQLAEEENLSFSPTRQGKMTLAWEKTEQGWNTAVIDLKPVPRKKQKTAPKYISIAYRLPKYIVADIEKLAGEIRPARVRDDGSKINDPYRFAVAPGEVVVRLLERAIHDYRHRKIHFKTQPEMIAQRVAGWAKS